MEPDLKHDKREGNSLERMCKLVWQSDGRSKIYWTLTTIGTIESIATYCPKQSLRKVVSVATIVMVYSAQLSTSVNMISQCGLELEPCRGLPTKKIRNAMAPESVLANKNPNNMKIHTREEDIGSHRQGEICSDPSCRHAEKVRTRANL